MGVSSMKQAYNFIIFILNGCAIGIIFDIFRIRRRSFKTSDFITAIEDIFFWMISGILTIFTITTFNYGEIRLYILIAVIVGIIIYMLTISKYFIKCSVSILLFIKKIISIPTTFLCNNVKAILSKICKIISKTIENKKNIKKNDKNAIQKKDF